MLIWQKFGCDYAVKKSCYCDKRNTEGSDSVVKIQDAVAFHLYHERLRI